MDEVKCGLMILFDLRASFDTVVYELLFMDCKYVGIGGDALTYLRSYLENRQYCIQIGRSLADKKTSSREVHQGSVLGPVLFCIYTIELSCILKKCKVGFKLFADDTQFYKAVDNIDNTEGKIKLIMDDVGKWMQSKQLKHNQDKMECLIVGKNKDIRRINIPTLCIGGISLETYETVRDLGILLDCNLSIKEQIQRVVRTTRYHLRNFGFVRKDLDETTKLLFHNYVISKLDYCNSLYYGLSNYLLKELQLVMNRAARFIKGLPPRERISPALIDLHWLPVKARIEDKIAAMSHQALLSGKPEYLRNTLKKFHGDAAMELRHETDLHRLLEPRSNSNMEFRTFERCAPRIYNKLPIDIKDCAKMDAFKKKLKTYLFQEAYDLNSIESKDDYHC